MSTPHIKAAPGDFADLVLMPGDPLRAQALATAHLSEVRQVNSVRNMLAFTGFWNGREVSIMGSGMGMPSISIYAHELFTEFGVQKIVRVGTCGGLSASLSLGDLIVATSASTDSAMNRARSGGWDFAPSADMAMLERVSGLARNRGLTLHAGEVMSTDWFYHPDDDYVNRVAALGILALDMETAALYALAKSLDRRALTLLTVSDVLPRQEHFSPEERQNAFGSVAETVLDALLTDATS